MTVDTPEFTVEMRAVESLRANPRNYQRHSTDQIARLAESLRTHGQEKPLVIREDGEIIAGHGLWEAARSLHWSQMACHVYHGSNPTAYLVADNYLATLAEPDPQMLANLLRELQAQEQLAATGYEPAELDKLLAELQAANPTPIVEEGEIPEPQEGPTRVLPGEVWQLGRHRVMCGDSTKAEDLDTLLDGARLNLIVTSPPYAEQRKEQYGGVRADEYGAWFLPMAALWKQRLAEDGSFFLNIKEHCENGERHLYVKKLVIALREEGGWKFVDEFCWERPGVPMFQPNRFKNGWEPVFHFAKSAAIKMRHDNVKHETDDYFQAGGIMDAGSGGSYIPHEKAQRMEGMALPSNVIRVSARASREERGDHAASFPVGLPAFFLRAYSDPGDTVLDPFLGSGTTLIAAERQGRVCYGMEILPRYADVCLARWEKFTGQTAERIHG